jgi:Ca2+-binding EF-hand superfamily protein
LPNRTCADGNITFQLSTTMLSEVRKQKFEYLFRVFDKNGGGILTESDIKSMFEGLNYDEEVQTAKKAARR